MMGARITMLLSIFSLVGLGLVGIRMEQTRCMARIQKHQLRQLALKRLVHERQLQIARLRSPSQIRRRVEGLELQVRGPHDLLENENSDGPRKYALAGD